MENTAAGVAITVCAGGVGSSTLMPSKYVREWKWENTWLVYSSLAYLLFPWLSAVLTVPHLAAVYAGVELETLFLTALFGLGWGGGVVLYGLGLDMVGLSLSSGIILGSSVVLGSFIPLLMLGSDRLWTRYGAQILIANAVMTAGVLLCARAGGLRERAGGHEVKAHGRRALRGIVICFLSGVLTPLLNVALAYGEPLTRNALAVGASAFNASNGVWALCVSMGSLPSIVFCIVKLGRGGTWKYYRSPRSPRNAFLCFLMGVFFIFSTILYGAAAGRLGRLGPVVGWPIYMSALILGNNFWGWYTGEWKGVSGRPVSTMLAGIALQIVGMALLGIAKRV
jgi:L-rhamnose-H+ transport protein